MTPEKQSLKIPHYPQELLPPAQLWIGNHAVLLEHIITFLQQNVCSHGGCNVCSTCRKIADHQHHRATWIAPTNLYTLDDLTPISSTISFALEENEHHYFIITKADFLTPQCANSLLKSLEEPASGYHFILLAQKEDALLPTIRSRCIMHYFKDQHEQDPHPKLWLCFTQPASIPPLTFLKDLEQTKINEQESIELLNQIVLYWLQQGKDHLISNDMQKYLAAEKRITLLKKALLMPPMPGSSALFWKNLFLQFNSVKGNS